MYEALKVLHLFSVISWMVVLLYLPRLFVYHAEAKIGGEHSDALKVMERRLLRGIGTPAMVATWIFGLWLTIGFVGFANNYWLYAKFLLVIGLTAYHFLLAKYRKDFYRNANKKSAKFFRLINEVPAVAMFIILILVIVQPF